MSKGNSEIAGGGAHYEVSVVFNRHLDQLYRLVERSPEDFISITIRQRGLNDFTAVLKRFGSDGQAEVCFSNGYDFVACLLAMEGSVSVGRWRVDVPYDERMKRGGGK